MLNLTEQDKLELNQAHVEYIDKLKVIAARTESSLESLIETNKLKIPVFYEITRKKYADSAFNVFQRYRALQRRTGEAENGMVRLVNVNLVNWSNSRTPKGLSKEYAALSEAEKRELLDGMPRLVEGLSETAISKIVSKDLKKIESRVCFKSFDGHANRKQLMDINKLHNIDYILYVFTTDGLELARTINSSKAGVIVDQLVSHKFPVHSF